MELVFLYSQVADYKLKQLETKYHECARSIVGVNRSEKISNKKILEYLNWLPVRDIIKKNKERLLLRVTSSKKPEYLFELLGNKNNRTSKYILPRIKQETAKAAFEFWGPQFLNNC